MKKKTLFSLLLIVTLFPFILSSCVHDNARQPVAMFMHDAQHSGVYQSPPVINNPHTVWKIKTDGVVISSPVVAGKTLYVGSGDSNLYAVNITTGKVKWRFQTNGAVNSTPLVARNTVFFLSYDGYFYAVNCKSGKLVWKIKTGGESVFKFKDYFNGSFQPDFWDFYLSSPVAQGHVVYFGSSDSSVYALNMDTGKQIWKFRTDGSIHSSPAIWKNTLVIGAWDSKIYGLDTKTGKAKWSYSSGRDTTHYIWLGVQASPSIGNGVAYVGSRDGHFYAFDVKNGDTLWVQKNFHRSWMPSSAAVGQRYLYTGSSDAFSFYSLNKKTGKIRYQTQTHAYTFSSPAIDSTMVYIGTANGRLLGIDKETGKMLWEYKTWGCRNDTLGFFNASGQLDKKRAKALTAGIKNMPALSAVYEKVFRNIGAVLSSPVLQNQVIYFGSCDGYIYAVSDKEQKE